MRKLIPNICALLAMGVPLYAGSNDPHTFKATTHSQTISEEQKEDIGDIRPLGSKGIASYFYGSAQAQVQYTTNARLRGDHDSSDGLFLPTLKGGFAVPIGGGFSLDLLGTVNTALYADNTDRAFWGASVAGSIDWRYGLNYPKLYVTAEPYYFQSYEGSHKLAAALGLTTGIEHSVVLNNGHTMLYGGYSYSHYFADPSLDDRNTNRFILGMMQQLNARLYAQVYYSFQYTDFESRDRHDLRQIGGLNFTYQFTKRLFASLNTSLADNDSNIDEAEYQSLSIGAGVTYQF